MRSVRFGLLIFMLFPCVLGWAQESDTSQQPRASYPAVKDPQAVSVINQALSVAGGTPALRAITDYMATGEMTLHSNADITASVHLKMLRPDQLRIDVALPDGERSQIYSNGKSVEKFEDGAISTTRTREPMLSGTLPLPYLHLLTGLISKQFSLTYKGIVNVDGQSCHDIRIQFVLPNGVDRYGLSTAFHTREFFIDTSTFLVVMSQDVLLPKGIPRQIRYSNYKLLNGISVPFSIEEKLLNQPGWTIQLSDVSFNNGLQDSDFALR